MGSTPYWGGIKSHSSHLAQHLRHAVSLRSVSPRCLPGVISGIRCGLPTAPWPRATASPPWGSMSTLNRGTSHHRLGALLLLEAWARESLADDRPVSKHLWFGSSQGLEWRSGRRLLVMPFTGPRSSHKNMWKPP